MIIQKEGAGGGGGRRREEEREEEEEQGDAREEGGGRSAAASVSSCKDHAAHVSLADDGTDGAGGGPPVLRVAGGGLPGHGSGSGSTASGAGGGGGAGGSGASSAAPGGPSGAAGGPGSSGGSGSGEPPGPHASCSAKGDAFVKAAGGAIEKMLLMHAFALLKGPGSSDACGDRGYISFGPCAPGASCLFFDSLASFTNPQPQQKEHSFFSFQSADGQDTSALAAASLDTDDEVDDRGVLVFSIVDAAPSNTSRALPRLAPRISQVDSLIISRVPVSSSTLLRRRCKLLLETWLARKVRTCTS